MKEKFYIPKEKLEKSLQAFKQVHRKKGLKVTPQRLGIYKELLLSKEHPSATVIYRKVKKSFPDISFDTVNRNLLAFSELGLIKSIECSGDAKRFDADTSQHHHFRCLRCGRITDVFDRALDNIGVPVQVRNRYRIFTKRVIMEGLCDKCLKRS